jgi:hypothetical protein
MNSEDLQEWLFESCASQGIMLLIAKSCAKYIDLNYIDGPQFDAIVSANFRGFPPASEFPKVCQKLAAAWQARDLRAEAALRQAAAQEDRQAQLYARSLPKASLPVSTTSAIKKPRAISTEQRRSVKLDLNCEGKTSPRIPGADTPQLKNKKSLTLQSLLVTDTMSCAELQQWLRATCAELKVR